MSQDSGAPDWAALSRALDRLEGARPSPARTAAIREAAVELEKLSGRAGKIREAEVIRIRNERKLALKPLADLTGISKARAGQIVKAAQRRESGDA